MQKKFLVSYLCIFFTLLFMLSLSHPSTEKIRGSIVAFFTPFWEQMLAFKQFLAHPHFGMGTSENEISQEQMSQLETENQILLAELTQIKQALEACGTLNTQGMQFDAAQAIPAKVIFRPLDAWNSSCWINVGEADNPTKRKIIAKNSPVLVGRSIIGIIDYVGTHQSRIRLITDSGLTPSVRAARGGIQEKALQESIANLLETLNHKRDLSIVSADREAAILALQSIQGQLAPNKKSWLLAKGELQGTSGPVWRGPSQILKGTGFNYDFDDSEGEARDLRTGKLVNQPNSHPIPLLKVGDLLVTTGMDGLFPAHLQVARVTKIELLKEGDYFYELEATPTAGVLNELSFVFVIPPIGYDKQDRPIRSY